MLQVVIVRRGASGQQQQQEEEASTTTEAGGSRRRLPLKPASFSPLSPAPQTPSCWSWAVAVTREADRHPTII